MKRSELIAAVPIRIWQLTPESSEIEFVSLDDIPEPFLGQLDADMRANQVPVVPGYAQCIFAQDWQLWVQGHWYGGAGQ
jgi:hypothetical protein